MKRTHLTSFWRGNKIQEQEEGEDSNGDNRIIMNNYKNYEAGLIPWPLKNYTCSFCRREFKSAQALGGHMNVHRRDKANLKQIPSWLFESHHHIPKPNPNPNFTSSSSKTPAHLEPSITNDQRSRTNPFDSARFNFLDHSATSYGDLTVEREKNMSNVRSREIKKSAMDASRREDDQAMRLELGGLGNHKQVIDLELRLGYPLN